MTNSARLAIGLPVLLSFCLVPGPSALAQPDGLFFPPVDGKWETVDPSSIGWDETQIDHLLEMTRESNASALVVLFRGRIVAERYWTLLTEQDDDKVYHYIYRGANSSGRPIEDVSSVQKSVASLLVGIAANKGLLDPRDSVAEYLGVSWSNADRISEDAITIRHLLTMSSGLNGTLTFQSKPGEQWSYNTLAYSKLLPVIRKATGKPIDQFSREMLTGPIGMKDSGWFLRTGNAANANPYGFATTARDLARLGLLILARGKWHEKEIVPAEYVGEAVTTQIRGTAYGYLWWTNAPHLDPKAHLISSAPRDLVAAMGIFEKRLYIVPSLDLVVVRLGDFINVENRRQYSEEHLFPDREFDKRFWEILLKACSK